MRRLTRGLLTLLLLALLAPSAWALSESDLARIWRNNGSVDGIQAFRFGLVDWPGRSVSVEGMALLRDGSAQARLLARLQGMQAA